MLASCCLVFGSKLDLHRSTPSSGLADSHLEDSLSRGGGAVAVAPSPIENWLMDTERKSGVVEFCVSRVNITVLQ